MNAIPAMREVDTDRDAKLGQDRRCIRRRSCTKRARNEKTPKAVSSLVREKKLLMEMGRDGRVDSSKHHSTRKPFPHSYYRTTRNGPM